MARSEGFLFSSTASRPRSVGSNAHSQELAGRWNALDYGNTLPAGMRTVAMLDASESHGNRCAVVFATADAGGAAVVLGSGHATNIATRRSVIDKMPHFATWDDPLVAWDDPLYSWDGYPIAGYGNVKILIFARVMTENETVIVETDVHSVRVPSDRESVRV